MGRGELRLSGENSMTILLITVGLMNVECQSMATTKRWSRRTRQQG